MTSRQRVVRNTPLGGIATGAACAIALAAAAVLAGASPAMGEDPPEFVRAWTGLSSPFGAGTDSSGNVYVSDSGNNRVQVFEYDATLSRQWDGSELAGAPGRLSSPRGIAVDTSGNVYVVDASNNRVQKFPAGFPLSGEAQIQQWGGTGTGTVGGKLTQPRDVAIDPSGNVYVADAINHRVQKFNFAGTFQRAWGWDVVEGGGTGFEICGPSDTCKAGVSGGGGGQFNTPWGVATDSQSNVYVGDTNNHRIQKFDSNGGFLAAWGWDVVIGGATGFEICTAAADCKAGVSGGGGGQFNLPREVAIDSSDNVDVYVVESGNNRVQKLTSSGGFLAAWGRDVVVGGDLGFEVCAGTETCQAGDPGSADGEFNLPFGLAVDPFGEVYVADSGNNRVQKFGALPVFAIDRASDDFGDQEVGAGPTAARTFTVTNTGGDRLIVDSVGLAGEADQFQLVADNCTSHELVPAPAGSCTVEVAFDPASAGFRQATLSFTHRTAGYPTEVTDVAIRGTGTEPAGSPAPTQPAPGPAPVSPAPSPLAPDLAPEAIVAKGKISVGKRAAFAVEVGCPAPRSEACQGKIEASAKATGKKRKKQIVVGSARYSVLPGGKAKVVIKLNKVGLRLLRRGRPAGRLPVTLTAESSIAGNAAVAPAKTVVVLGGKRKKGR